MTLQTLITLIHQRLQAECFSDLVDTTGLAVSTVWRWRNDPPQLPSAKVLTVLARLCNLEHYLKHVEMPD